MANFKSKTACTSRLIGQLLPGFMSKLSSRYGDKPSAILEAWPSVIGPKLAPMTRALTFKEGVLFVAVDNATLYSLLNQHDKPRIIQNLRDKFPQTMIKTVVFQRR